MKRSSGAILTPTATIFFVFFGCRAHPPATPPPYTPSPAPSPTIALSARRPEVRLFDTHGKTIAVLRGGQGAFQPAAGVRGLGSLQATSAILYRDGAPALAIAARDVRADPQRRVLNAVGDVVAQTLGSEAGTRLRAQAMTWRYDANELTGRGEVLLTHGQTIQLPARAFRADTRLRRVRFLSDDAPASGNL